MVTALSIRVIRQVLLGVLILGGSIAVAMGVASILVNALFIVGIFLAIPAMNLALWITAGIMMFYGAQSRERFGWFLAPLVFFGLWCAISVGQRLWVATTLASQVPPPAAVDTSTKLARTLIVEGLSHTRKLVADGYVDRFVDFQTEHGTITKISELRIGKGDECTEEDRKQSTDLKSVGRIDECYITRPLSELPDGLLLRAKYQARRNRGCCDEIAAVLRENGEERVISTWQRGYSKVLTYFPVIAGPRESVGLWQASSGYMQSVWYGTSPLTPSAIVEALYQVDLRAPLKPSPYLAAQIAEIAKTLSQSTNREDRIAAYNNVWQALQKGYADDTTIEIAVAALGIFDEYRLEASPQRFFNALNPAQQETFRRMLLLRLSKPEECYCDPIRLLRADTPSTSAEAMRLFKERDDLLPWQYSSLLNLSGRIYSVRNEDPTPDCAKLLEFIVNGNSKALVPRLAAFSAAIYNYYTDPELVAVTDRIMIIPDSQLREFVKIKPTPPSLRRERDVPQLDEAIYRSYLVALHSRVNSVADPKLRQELLEEVSQRLRQASTEPN